MGYNLQDNVKGDSKQLPMAIKFWNLHPILDIYLEKIKTLNSSTIYNSQDNKSNPSAHQQIIGLGSCATHIYIYII